MSDRTPPAIARPPFAAVMALGVAAIGALLVAPAPVAARTVLLTIDDCDRAAAIHAEAPRLSWAARRHGSYSSPAPEHDPFLTDTVRLTEASAMLMRFDLEAIPPGQRIVHAELVVPVAGVGGNEPRFYLWRLLADWGAGVSHAYRRVEPGEDGELVKQPWQRPGARGISSDRATRPTDIVRVTEDERAEKVINVTEDVELWYDQRAANHGWLFSVEDPEVSVDLDSPVYHEAERWTLRITYEPHQQQAQRE